VRLPPPPPTPRCLPSRATARIRYNLCHTQTRVQKCFTLSSPKQPCPPCRIPVPSMLSVRLRFPSFPFSAARSGALSHSDSITSRHYQQQCGKEMQRGRQCAALVAVAAACPMRFAPYTSARWFSDGSSGGGGSGSSSSGGGSKIIYRPPTSSRFVLCHCVRPAASAIFLL
jgi:hypothetical protein